MARRSPIQRSTLVPAARYDAAGNGRRLARWNPPSAGPTRATHGLQKIRDRARDAGRNDWPAGSHVQKWTTNLVGTGIVPRWKDRSLAPLWADWARQADADHVLDIYGLQALAVRTWIEGGECFIRARWRDLAAPLAAPVQIQLLEPELCPVMDASAWPGMPAGHEMRQGVEFNRYGRRVAYWFYKSHPGDNTTLLRPREDDLVRVLAADVRHLFEPKRPGQVRGVSDFANVLVRLRQSGDFEDAVNERQRLANLFTLFITRQLPEKWLSELDLDPLTGMPAVWNGAGDMLVGLEPGAAMELKPGENVQFANPPEAGTTFSEYMRTLHLGTAAGGGLPYELLTGDIREVSDRSLRVMINEFRRYAQQRQWHNIIPQLTQPVVEWWAEALALAGRLSPAQAEEARRPRHSPHGWEYIHPVQDVEGKVKAIDAGLVSRDAVIAERGDDPTDVDNERREAQQREQALGISQRATAGV
jgi:lambda family phage portal protein